MPRKPWRASIRLWQTSLFVAVIMVAILILSGSLSAGLKNTLTEMSQTNELRNASALARRLEAEFPITAASLERVRQDLLEYRDIYGSSIWVYNASGRLIDSANDSGPGQEALDAARAAVKAGNTSYATVDLRKGGWVIAAKPILATDGKTEGTVVTAGSVADSLAILDAVRFRLWITFWVSLIAAGSLGYWFSALMAKRIREMSEAATAIADGDFEQRLPTGYVPDEIHDLADSYNRMAVSLGEAFGAVQESQQRLSAVVASMAEGLVSFDSKGVIRVINQEAMLLLGLEGRELVGIPAEEMVPDAEVLGIIRTGLVGDSIAKSVTLGQHTVLLHCTPLIGTAGNLRGAVLLLADVTEQQRIEDAQRRFIADASHEMRTPLAALKGILELLIDGAADDPAVRDDFLSTMQFEADRLGRLVTDLLTLAQLEAGSLQLKLTSESAADLLGTVASVMNNLAERAGATLTVDLPDGDIRVMADRDRAVQVLLSFTDNALKHSPSGSTVRLRAVRRGDRVLLAVADEGSGINAEELTRVFERFYRADEARAGGGGAGLGLAIAKEIVEAHGSRIEVHSEPGTGTTFGFELPVA